jgi:hypothetical protein
MRFSVGTATSAALFSRLTELHWNKKRFFQSSADYEQRELSSFIDIFTPRHPFTNLPPEPISREHDTTTKGAVKTSVSEFLCTQTF